MLFCSQAFLWFFAAVFLAYWLLPWDRARVAMLLAASFAFYATWNAWLAVLIGFSATLDYLLARGMDATPSPRRRRLLLGVSLAANLGLLCYFKYANFFLESLQAACDAAELGTSFPLLSVVLPVGISFYTFEAINYMVDVYRRRVPAERSLPHFLLFILFFPHLVAGPIVRARDFLPQVRRHKRASWLRWQLGAQLFLLGLFKKLAIADRMAQFADPVFKEPGAYGSGALWLAVLAYALQIYCDFSGYTDMAIGCAHLLGYKLARNFDLPYLAANVSEFWRRWHISLSGWLRDYLFIPLGGSRAGGWGTARNLLITMTLGGLWHGASWTFVVWGVLHGLLLVVHRAFRGYCEDRPRLDAALRTAPGMAVRIGLTFLSVALCWVFFRATTFAGAAAVLGGLFVPRAGLSAPLHPCGLWGTLAVVAVCHLLGVRGLWPKATARLPAAVLGMGYAAVLLVALVLAPHGTRPFIYFQF